MFIPALMAALHHLCAFTLTACIAYEFIAFRQTLSVAEARRLQQVDLGYGLSAGLLLIVGLLRVFFFEKSANFYAINPMFWVKMGLFASVGLLSIYPTVRFLRWNALLSNGQPLALPEAEHRRIRRLLNWEMVGLTLILFAAPMMARAVGMG